MLVQADFATEDGKRITGRFEAAWDTEGAHSGAMILSGSAWRWRIERGDLPAAQLTVIQWSNIDLELAEFNGLSIVNGKLVKFPGEYVTHGPNRGICHHRLNRENEEFLDYVFARWQQPDPVTVRPAGRPDGEPVPAEPE